MATIPINSIPKWLTPQDEDWLNLAAAEAYQQAEAEQRRTSQAARTGAAVELPALHPAQQTIEHDAQRFNVICCGRRFGKDVLGIDRLIRAALTKQPVAWFAPTYRMLADNWRVVRRALLDQAERINEQEKRIDLRGGGSIDMWSLDHFDAARGRKYARIVINEAALVRGLQEAWEMVLRPTLADLAGDAYFLSTPKGLNYFYTLWSQAETSKDWARFHFTTSDNPYIDQAEIEAMRLMLPDRVYRQEILAEFVEDGSYFQGVAAAAVIERPDQPIQHPKHTLVMGVDWAKSNDFTVITVACRECNRVVDWARFNQIDYHIQRGRLIELANKWHVTSILAESNSIGEPNIEELSYAGLPIKGFATTAASKPILIEGLQLALLSGFKVPKEYADELYAYEVITTSGRSKFSAPEGLHDDTVISAALAYQAVSNKSTSFAYRY